MLAAKSPYIDHAYQQLQVISQDKEKRLEYEANEKAIRDHNQLMYEAEQRGMEQGIEQGMKIIILDGLTDNLSKERILHKLQQYFSLPEEKAIEYYERLSAND